MVVDLKENEVVVKAGDTMFLNGEKAKGKLILTNQRLYFKSFNIDQKKYDKEILPVHIQEIIYFSTQKIFPNGLSIITKGGEELKFQIKKRNSWGEMINKMY